MNSSLLPWGVDSEYGVLEHVLLGPVNDFSWGDDVDANAVIRRAREKGRESSNDKVVEQHGKLVELLEAEGVSVHFADRVPNATAQVFTRDPAFMSPWGLVMGRLERPKRRGEHIAVQRFVDAHDIPTFQYISQGSLEGGDVHVAKPGKILIGYTNTRTFKDAAKELSEIFVAEGWEAKLVFLDAHYLHLDLIFNMVSEDTAIMCTDVLYPDEVKSIKDFLGLKRVIHTSYHQAMNLAGNVLCIGNDRVIVSVDSDESFALYGKKLSSDLKETGFHPLELDLSQFTNDGGGPHCLSLPLRRSPVL